MSVSACVSECVCVCVLNGEKECLYVCASECVNKSMCVCVSKGEIVFGDKIVCMCVCDAFLRVSHIITHIKFVEVEQFRRRVS